MSVVAVQSVSFPLRMQDKNALKSFYSLQSNESDEVIGFYFCRFIASFICVFSTEPLFSFPAPSANGLKRVRQTGASTSRSPHRRRCTLRHDRPHTCHLAYPPPPTCVFLSPRSWVDTLTSSYRDAAITRQLRSRNP